MDVVWDVVELFIHHSANIESHLLGAGKKLDIRFSGRHKCYTYYEKKSCQFIYSTHISQPPLALCKALKLHELERGAEGCLCEELSACSNVGAFWHPGWTSCLSGAWAKGHHGGLIRNFLPVFLLPATIRDTHYMDCRFQGGQRADGRAPLWKPPQLAGGDVSRKACSCSGGKRSR